MQKYSEWITGNKLALPKFILADLFNKDIRLLKSPKVNLLLNNCISKLAKLQSKRNYRAGVEKQKKKTSNIDFLFIFWQSAEIYQRRRCVQTKVGDTALFKPQNPGEVVVLAKSAMFA